MAAALTITETAVRKLLKELGDTTGAAKASLTKLTKLVADLPAKVEDADEDDFESLSKASAKLLEKIVTAADKEQRIEIEAAGEDEVDEEKPAKKTAAKSKTAAKEKTEKKESGEGPSIKTQQGHAINKVLANADGPLDFDTILKKASKIIPMSDKRVEAHLKYLVENKETVKKVKGGKYALA